MHKYDREITDGVDGAPNLKPDLIGLMEAKAFHPEERAPWSALDVVVEVEESWPELVAQAGTYARALLNAHPIRTYALIIGYNHVEGEVRFLFFHRGG
ncbi:hypothetical protein DL93DRAFT_2065954, partial [Clavulina sp. PMI_390]